MPRKETETEGAARLYDSFGPSLFRYALMILGRRDAAEDAIQQVFVALIDGGTRDIADPRAYLRTAVRNACYSHLRAGRGRAPGTVTAEEILEARPDTSEPLSAEDRLALEAGLLALPAEQREVIHLHVFEGLTFKEVAAATGEPPNTVASRYRYALGKLRAGFRGLP
jgi:RNA polymerase sigma-70 factor (ECF subfamily)